MISCLLWQASNRTSAAEDIAKLSASQQAEFFESKIRPVLIEHCYSCHNSSDNAEGGLAVDHRDAFLQGGDGGTILKPGDSANSRLLAILRHEIDGLEMPEGGPKLDDSIIADIERWIANGAYDPRDEAPDADSLASMQSWQSLLERRKAWWSFQPIVDHLPPTTGLIPALDAPNLHPVDRFVIAKLSDTNLRPNPPADSPTLVRRLYFALIGLPPTVEESQLWTTRIDSAALDQRDTIVETLVDELLASSQFGHRWARHWMDWIRYAESHGSEGDPAIDNAWMYRDYLIRALNDDVPIDQLIREHVAGDLLENPRINQAGGFNESVIGTAHWRMVFHGFAPTDALDERVRFTDDQINAFTKAFLGITVSCARCHDHKFDAISQADYYALFGVLNSCRPGRTTIDLPEDQNRYRDELTVLKKEIKNEVTNMWLKSLDSLPQHMQNRIAADGESIIDSSLLGIYQTLFKSLDSEKQSDTKADWQRLRTTHLTAIAPEPNQDSAVKAIGVGNDLTTWFRYGNGLSTGPSAAGEFVVSGEGEGVISAIYPAGIYSNLISSKHSARLTSPDIKLDGDYEIWANVIGDNGASIRYVVQNYPRNGTVYPVTQLQPKWQWQRFDVQYWNGDDIHIELAAAMDAPLLVSQQPRSWFGVRDVQLVRKGDSKPDDSDRSLAVLFATWNEAPTSIDSLNAAFVDCLRQVIFAWQADTLDDDQTLLLNRCLQEGNLANRIADIPGIESLINRYRELESDILVPRRVPSLDETVGHDQPLMIRGNHKTLGESIPRRFLEAIDSTPYSTSIANDPNVSSRDASGRLRLAEDLLRDDNPLTRRVIANRIWHHLFGRGIVSTPDNLGRLGDTPTHPELLDWLACRLPENQWSLKQLVRMLVTSKTWQASSTPSAEAIVTDPDNRMWSHARLNRLEAEAIRDSILSVSGSIDLNSFGPPVGGNVPRRSIYVNVRRNSLDPFLRVFDFPEPFSATGRRDTTNVPAQSLTIMNDPQVVTSARSWAKHVLADQALQTDHQRINQMFQAALGRPALDTEVNQSLQFLEQSKQLYSDLQTELNQLDASAQQARESIEQIMAPVRQRLTKERESQSLTSNNNSTNSKSPTPIHAWDFADGVNDMIASESLTLMGDAKVKDGALVVQGSGYAITQPLDVSLRSKTVEAWVRLSDDKQRGGGVMTIQTLDGSVFDSIVFGEKSPGQWLAGSNNFARTESFDGEVENEAIDHPIQIAVVYEENGRITAYRNGKPYGKPYQSRGVQPFVAGQSILSFGIRHLPAGGNRMLTGGIHQARLYDVALSAEDVLASFENSMKFVSDSTVMASLPVDQQAEIERLRGEIKRIEEQRREIESIATTNYDEAIWSDLAHSLITLPEFIYVR